MNFRHIGNGCESSVIHQPSTAALLLLAKPKIKLFYSVNWCESSENALFIEKSWIIMLRIKIPCNRATSCNSSGNLKLPSSQCLRLACPRTDAHSASAVMIKRAYHCSRCSCGIMMQRIKIPCWLGIVQDLPSTWLVQEAWLCSRCAAELWIECHARGISITCMYHPRFMHAIFEGDSFIV